MGRRPEARAVPQVAAPQRGRPRAAGEHAGDAGQQDGEERGVGHERRPVKRAGRSMPATRPSQSPARAQDGLQELAQAAVAAARRR